jgi:hypothetical protein
MFKNLGKAVLSSALILTPIASSEPDSPVTNEERIEEEMLEEILDWAEHARRQNLLSIRIPTDRELAAIRNEALLEIHLPKKPSSDDVIKYIRSILESRLAQLSEDQLTEVTVENPPYGTLFEYRYRWITTAEDEVEKLCEIPNKYLELFLNEMRDAPAEIQANYVPAVVNCLADESHKNIVIAHLPEYPRLIHLVIAKDWVDEAQSVLIGALNSAEQLPIAWLYAASQFKDPRVNEGLVDQFLNRNDLTDLSVFYLLKDISGLGPQLEQAVSQKWGKLNDVAGPQLKSFAPVAVYYGHVDALRVLIDSVATNDGQWPVLLPIHGVNPVSGVIHVPSKGSVLESNMTPARSFDDRTVDQAYIGVSHTSEPQNEPVLMEVDHDTELYYMMHTNTDFRLIMDERAVAQNRYYRLGDQVYLHTYITAGMVVNAYTGQHSMNRVVLQEWFEKNKANIKFDEISRKYYVEDK